MTTKKRQRILAVQTSRGSNPEAKVLATLVRSWDQGGDLDQGEIDLLLIQGTDERFPREHCFADSTLFENLPSVRILPVNMGYLEQVSKPLPCAKTDQGTA